MKLKFMTPRQAKKDQHCKTREKIQIKNEYLIYIWDEINSVNWTNMTQQSTSLSGESTFGLCVRTWVQVLCM